MPVVPIRKRDSAGQGFSPKVISPEAEPWALMAAAQMDVEGRLVESNLSREAGSADLDAMLKKGG